MCDALEEMQLRELCQSCTALARAHERRDACVAERVVVEAELAQPWQRARGARGGRPQRKRKVSEAGVANTVPAEPQREQGVQRARRNLQYV